MEHMKKKNKIPKDPRQKIMKAIMSMRKYSFRTATGLSRQTKIPVEHLEHYLVQLAQRGEIVVLVGDDGQILARMVSGDDT